VSTVTHTVAGRFGAYGDATFQKPHGGLEELERAYAEAQADSGFSRPNSTCCWGVNARPSHPCIWPAR